MALRNVLAFVMAGGEGSRLRPFTEHLPKPALPFGGKYRIIDFVLSNMHNSGLDRVYVLTQYRPRILLEHIARTWAVMPRQPGGFVAPVLPRDTLQRSSFRGTADAVHHCLGLIRQHAPDLVAVFAADHVYRMDIRQMIAFHLERDADASVAAVPVPVQRASGFGVIRTDREQRIRGFQEKPRRPAQMPDKPLFAYASMGNYLFRPAVLEQALAAAAERGDHDFGQHVLPRLIGERRVYAYDFSRNRVPGILPHEEHGNWRDVGNVGSYIDAHRDLLGPAPRFQLDNPAWPILCGGKGCNGQHDSILGPESVAEGAMVRDSVLQRGVVVEPKARVESCIVMDGVKIRGGACLRHVLVGAGSDIAPRARIGYNRDLDRSRFAVTPAGTVIVPPSFIETGRREILRHDGQLTG